MYRVYFISSMYFVPHFGHAKVYEASIWTSCFQISAKTLVIMIPLYTKQKFLYIETCILTTKLFIPNVMMSNIVFKHCCLKSTSVWNIHISTQQCSF